jgi:hypothetical protein
MKIGTLVGKNFSLTNLIQIFYSIYLPNDEKLFFIFTLFYLFKHDNKNIINFFYNLICNQF